MNHRHLLPNEIDLLLDGDVGFGMAPLRAHAATCERCSAELESARQVVEALDHLPHFTPSPFFADRVMARTHVFQPWHVAALDSARRVLPSPGPARILVGVAASSIALIVTVLSIFLVTQIDALVFVSQLVLQRGRDFLLGSLDMVGGALLGDAALQALRASGATGAVLGLVAVIGSGAIAAGLLRAAVVASRRNR